VALHTEGHVKTGKMTIKRGIFQGDCLSPLLVCLALAPLTIILNKQGAEYDVKGINKISHLFCRMT
jgi:hypothetical protein